MADLRELVGELASTLAGTDAAVVHGLHRPGRGSSLRTFDAAGRSVFADTGVALHDLLRRMDEVLRPAGEDRAFVVEFTRAGSELRHTFDLPAVSPVRLVLDPDYRHPSGSTPSAPPAGAVTDRPTDPAVLAAVRALVAEFADAFPRKTGMDPEFGAGHPEEEIRAAEAAIGLRLPEELRALYRTVSTDECGLLRAGALLPLDEVVSTYLEGGPGSVLGSGDDLFAVNPVCYEAYPAGRVRRMSRNERWVEVGTDWGGNCCLVDLDPAPEGTFGQIIQYGRDFFGPPGYVAESVTTALSDHIALLRDDEKRWHGSHQPYSRSERIDERRVADVVAGLDVQELYLNFGAVVDLADLAPLRNLRSLSINRAGVVVAAVPPAVPLEWLSVDAAEVDLSPLGRHPSLWGLKLAAREPVSVAPLTELPALAHLDLSAADVTDLHVLADLTGLRVLELNLTQWLDLRDRGPLPPCLAAAALNGFVRLEQADEWAGWLRAAAA
ncbi:SMI1/KNR4 family protein [Asanoa sp. NPDC050611]|uniref:SMI1/KNR4 family protein n=1 Tax=Asanoa sp. NPDC050611 TaxID=3157098 RepID=UPI0033DC8D58